MKSITKKIAAILLVCVMALSVVALVACTGKNVYTVKVVDVDGNPYTQALVQACKVNEDGSLGTCYSNMVSTDEKGIATLEIGKEIPDKDVDELEIHLQNLPVYLTFDAVRMHKGESATVTVRLKKSSELSSFEEGTGFGEYQIDSLTKEVTERIELDTFKPYVVEEDHAYAMKFTSATQKIYYEFRAWEEGVYKVYSVGGVDASVTQLTGSRMSGIRHPSDSSLTNDNVSATDKNFSFEFIVDKSIFDLTQGGEDINYASCFFEVALSNASDVNKDAIIVFEYVDVYEPEPDVEEEKVYPAKTLTVFEDQSGRYVDLEYDAKCVKGDDGYYHVDSKDGAIVIATLGNDTVTPKLLGNSFLNIYYKQNQSFSFYDQDLGKNKNYLPLIEAYSKACNNEGRYPLTDELIDFFNVYILNAAGGAGWFESQLHTTLPKGSEWIIWCGYYSEGSSQDQGTEEYPFTLEPGDNVTITIPSTGTVYYAVFTHSATTFTITSDSTNIKLSVYDSSVGAQGATVTTSNEDGFSCETVVSGYYYFVFSTKDGSADTYSVQIIKEEIEVEGTWDNPIEIKEFKEYTAEVVEHEVQSPLGTVTETGSMNYVYTVHEGDSKLYFSWDENTKIIVYVGMYVQLSSVDADDAAKLMAGVDVSELVGEMIRIEVITVNEQPGTISFEISDALIIKE